MMQQSQSIRPNVQRSLVTYPVLTCVGICALAAFVLLFDFNVAADKKLWNSFCNAGHLPLFALIAIAFYNALSSVTPVAEKRLGSTVVKTFLLCAIVIVVVELVQPLFHRNAEFEDVWNGLLGAAIGLTAVVVWHPISSTHPFRATVLRVVQTISATLLVIATFYQPLLEFAAVWHRISTFPMLADFESSVEIRLWDVDELRREQNTVRSLSSVRVARGSYSLHVRGTAGEVSRLRYEAGDHNWSSYKALHLSVYIPKQPLSLHVRMNSVGERYGAFDTDIALTTGWNHVVLPISPVQIDRVRFLHLHAEGAGAPVEYYLDAVYLR